MKIESLDRSVILRRIGAFLAVVATIAAMWTFNSTPAEAATFTVNAKGFAFTPADMTVHVGDTVRWVNGDAESHAVQGGSLSSPEITPGSSFSATFTSPDVIEYICRFHTYMNGNDPPCCRPARRHRRQRPDPEHRPRPWRLVASVPGHGDDSAGDRATPAAEHLPGRTRRPLGPDATER